MAIYNREDYRTALPQLESAVNDMVDRIYPVGSYYETSDARFNPNNKWGGRWEVTETSGVYRWHRKENP